MCKPPTDCIYKRRKSGLCFTTKSHNNTITSCGNGISLISKKGCCLKSLLAGPGIILEDLQTEIKISSTNGNDITGTTTTTGLQPSILALIDVDNNTVMALSMIVIAVDINTGENNVYFINTKFLNYNGTITISPLLDKSQFIDMAGTSVEFIPSVNSVKVKVIGISGKILKWSLKGSPADTQF